MQRAKTTKDLGKLQGKLLIFGGVYSKFTRIGEIERSCKRTFHSFYQYYLYGRYCGIPDFIRFKYSGRDGIVLHGSYFDTSEFVFKSTA